MKKYTLSLIIAFLFLTSCKDDEGLPLAPDLVAKVKAYDLDNNGNSSDIRVDFGVINNLNVTEYRVMVVPSNISNSFNVGNAISLPAESYLEIVPESFKNAYSITRLPSNLFDVNGGQIRNLLEYVVAVLVVGTGNHQLSEFSRPFRLIDQGIYAGDYEGTDCCSPVKSTIVFGGGKYSGPYILVVGDLTLGRFSFIITETDSIKEFIWNLNIACIGWLNECVNRPEICTGEWIGSGTLSNELFLDIFAVALGGGTCMLGENLPLTLTRQ